MKGKNSIIILMVLIFSLFSGCSSNRQSLLKDNKQLKEENITLNKKVSDQKVKNTVLDKTVKDLNEKLKGQQSDSTKGELFPIYIANINTYKKEIGNYMYIPKGISVKEKLDVLVRVLSEVKFNDLPIEVLKIEKVEGKQVAVINLKESEENQGIKDFSKLKGRAWTTSYFQGSTGGQITSTCLIETMLQRKYKGEWIDGVKFLYNNSTCDFQHTPQLSKISYR